MLSTGFEEALVYATRLHKDQYRKGTPVPYISHLLAVCSIVLDYGGGEDEAIAALLHDAVEDQGGQSTLDAIRERFGAAVADVVAGCSDSDVWPKPPWRRRKEEYIAHLYSASPAIRLVSAADKLHNAQSILRDYRLLGDELWTRFHAGQDEQLWYYRTVTSAFQQTETVPALVAELDRTVGELERLVAAEKETP